MGSKVDVKIMNVTFQSRPGVKNSSHNPHDPHNSPEPIKIRPKRSKQLVVDTIVGGKIMKAKQTDDMGITKQTSPTVRSKRIL